MKSTLVISDYIRYVYCFAAPKTAPSFFRSDLGGLRCKVKRIVETILNKKAAPRGDREYLSLDKTATIWRNGAITVECRHRFRFTTTMNKVTIPYAIWRVSQALPPIESLLNGARDVGRGYLRCVPINCGGPGQRTCHHRIIPKIGGTENEHVFDVEVSDLDIHAGDELTYEIAWGYRNAFRDPTKQGGKPNSVGLRTGERGMVRSVSLTVQFQRDLADDASEPACFSCLVTRCARCTWDRSVKYRAYWPTVTRNRGSRSTDS